MLRAPVQKWYINIAAVPINKKKPPVTPIPSFCFNIAIKNST